MLPRYCGNHFAIYIIIESLCCAPETNVMFYVHYITSKFLKTKLKFFLKVSFILDKREGREKERERNISVWLPVTPHVHEEGLFLGPGLQP